MFGGGKNFRNEECITNMGLLGRDSGHELLNQIGMGLISTSDNFFAKLLKVSKFYFSHPSSGDNKVSFMG